MAIYLITGVSSGIGNALTNALTEKGNTIYGVARRSDILRQMKESLKDRFIPFICDVTNKEDVKKICSELPELPEIVILNAGVAPKESPKKISVELHRKVMEVNYFGAINWVEELYPEFRARGSGTFVAISSLAAYRGLPRAGAYCASKGALSNTFESLRIAYYNTGLDFITVHPGFVETPLLNGRRPNSLIVWSAEKAAKYIIKKIQRKKLIIGFPWYIKLAVNFSRMLPAGLYRILMRE